MVDTQIELYTKTEYAAHLAEHAHDETNRLAVQYVSALLQLNCIIQPLAYNRITHVLQFLCIRFGQDLIGGVYTKISVPLTQLQIAQMAGVTRETAAIELAKLKAQGVVTVKSKFYNVHAKKLLQTITSKEIQSVDMN